MTDRPTVTVGSIGGSRYKVTYTMFPPDQKPTAANATVKPSSVLEFSATSGSSEFHDVSKAIPEGISIIDQKSKDNTHVVTVKCSIDPTEYIV